MSITKEDDASTLDSELALMGVGTVSRSLIN